jgi:putative transposase
MHHALYVACRKRDDREAGPTAAIIDSQSVKSAEKSGACIDPNGYDAGKKIKGKNRHILVDTLGLLLHAMIHPGDVEDRDGGILLVSTLFGTYPFLEKLFAYSHTVASARRKQKIISEQNVSASHVASRRQGSSNLLTYLQVIDM